jgi:hypothetical protein
MNLLLVFLGLIYLLGSITTIVILIILLQRKSKKQCNENFRTCSCSSQQGGRQSNCQDNDTVAALYNSNKLTEYTKLADKGWVNTSPGEVDFPLSQGCNWPTSVSNPKWTSWDFTDFGN